MNQKHDDETPGDGLTMVRQCRFREKRQKDKTTMQKTSVYSGPQPSWRVSLPEVELVLAHLVQTTHLCVFWETLDFVSNER